MSRAPDRARIYTDEKEMLLQYASELGERKSALELVSGKINHKDIVLQKQREEHSKTTKEAKWISKSKPQKDYEPEINSTS